MPNPQFLGVTPGHAVMAGNEQKAPSLWIKGATFQQIAAAGFGIATASGAWRAVHRALAQIPKQEADQACEDGGRYAGTGTAAARP
jgi:hypothetical protein